MSFEESDYSLLPSRSWSLRPEPKGPERPEFVQLPPHQTRRSRPVIHVLLFLAALFTTMQVGGIHYAFFQTGLTGELGSISLASGAWYSLTILAILSAHEFGHYFTCRYYRVDASLPYFLPAPWPFISGTFGAFIRIRSPIPTKSILFDIGASGPIAGFVVAVPALFLGLYLSELVPIPDDFGGATLGEPLLFQLAAWLIWGDAPAGDAINLHPVGLAAWFGLLVTALNLLPIGQLDGGHISYATLGSKSTALTIAGVLLVIGLTFVSLSWIVWAILMVLMIAVFGPRHPRTIDDHLPLDRTRQWVAIVTLVIFVFSFTPAPIQFSELITSP